MKRLILIAALMAATNALAFCDWDDHECNAAERERQQMELDLYRQQEEHRRELEEIRWEQERAEARRREEERNRYRDIPSDSVACTIAKTMNGDCR